MISTIHGRAKEAWRRVKKNREQRRPDDNGITRMTAAVRRTGHYGTSAVTADQSALMPTDLITLAHFSVSSAMSLPKSAGETTSGVPPKSASRACILGSARPALISLLSLSTMSSGVFLGMPTPYQLLAS